MKGVLKCYECFESTKIGKDIYWCEYLKKEKYALDRCEIVKVKS